MLKYYWEVSMELNVNEKRLLTVYPEFFGHCYDLNDKRNYKASNQSYPLMRDAEMQNIIYILETLGIVFGYDFYWDRDRGASCIELQTALYDLSEKAATINSFYDIIAPKYNNFERYFDCETSDRIKMASYVLEDVLKEEYGSIHLARMLRIAVAKFPRANLPYVMAYLAEENCAPSPELAKEIWRDLALLGIKSIEPGDFVRQRTIKRHNS